MDSLKGLISYFAYRNLSSISGTSGRAKKAQTKGNSSNEMIQVHSSLDIFENIVFVIL